MPPSIYTSQTMYYAAFKEVESNTILLVPEDSLLDLSEEDQACYVSLKELGFTAAERVTCASLIDWVRSVRRIHTRTEELYQDALEDADLWEDSHAAPGSIRHDLVCYQNAVKETAAALKLAQLHCNDIFGAVAAALRRYYDI